MRRVYSIANLIVEMIGEQTLRLVSGLPGFDVFEIDDQNSPDTDISIHLDKNIDTTCLTNVHTIHHFKVLDIDHFFAICKEGYLFEMYRMDGGKIVSIIYNPEGNNVFISPCDCVMSLKYALWIAYLLPAIQKNILPIHASTIVKDSGAILFLGESGTGKSTHTRLWMKYIDDSYLLNDDSPLLSLKDDKIFVSGSPWSGKTHCYKQEIVPLKAIVRLSQYSQNIMNCHNVLGSIGAIHPSFPPFIAYDSFLSEKLLNMIDQIVKRTPIYELKCLPNKQAAEVAYTTIY